MSGAQPRVRPWLATWAFGGGLLSAAQGAVGLWTFRRMLDPTNTAEYRLVGYLTSRVEYYLVVELGKAALVLALGVALVAAAGGLFRGAAWARRVAVVYGLAAIPTHLGYLAFELRRVLPALHPGVSLDSAAPARDVAAGVALAAVGFAAHAALLLMAILIPSTTRRTPPPAPATPSSPPPEPVAATRVAEPPLFLKELDALLPPVPPREVTRGVAELLGGRPPADPPAAPDRPDG